MSQTLLFTDPIPDTFLACPLWNIHPFLSVCPPSSGASWLGLHSVSGQHFWIKLLHSHSRIHHKYKELGVSLLNLLFSFCSTKSSFQSIKSTLLFLPHYFLVPWHILLLHLDLCKESLQEDLSCIHSPHFAWRISRRQIVAYYEEYTFDSE